MGCGVGAGEGGCQGWSLLRVGEGWKAKFGRGWGGVDGAVHWQFRHQMHSTLSWPSRLFFSYLFDHKMNIMEPRNYYHLLAY